MNILFSIIIPTFNRADTLLNSINSVLCQTYSNFELIIVDDGSTDDTRQIVEKIKDNRIHYIYQINSGVCVARNSGIKIAKGKYLTFLDSDDSVTNEWLMNFYNILAAENTDIVFCDMILHNHNGKIKLRKALYRYSETTANRNGMFMPGSFCINSELFKNIGGFDENIKFGEFTDIDFTLQNINISRSFTNKVGINYYPSFHGGGKNQLNKILSINYLLKKHNNHFRNDKNAKWLFLQNAAISYIRINQFKEARKYLLNAYFVNPTKFKTLLRFLLSLSPFLSKKIWSKSFS